MQMHWETVEVIRQLKRPKFQSNRVLQQCLLGDRDPQQLEQLAQQIPRLMVVLRLLNPSQHE